MEFNGFTSEDFAVFDRDEFDDRMAGIKRLVRPKLKLLAERFARELEQETDLQIHPHVALHARRRVNPPDETWFALGRSKRGYKQYVHFAMYISGEGISPRVVLKPEASDDKRALAEVLDQQGEQLIAMVEDRPSVSWYHAPVPGTRGFHDIALTSVDRDDLEAMAERLRTIKSSEFKMGTMLPHSDSRVHDGKQLVGYLREQFHNFLPFYLAVYETAIVA